MYIFAFVLFAKNILTLFNHLQTSLDSYDLSEKPDRAYRFFLDAYRLRIEDYYVMTGEAEGLYAEGCGCEGASLRYFSRYIKKSKKDDRKGVYPSWWSEAHHSKVIELALLDEFYNIKFAVEQSDIAAQWGKEMCEVMRSLATKIEGRHPTDDYNDDDDDDDGDIYDDYDNYDDDDDDNYRDYDDDDY